MQMVVSAAATTAIPIRFLTHSLFMLPGQSHTASP
jgi:hypothetical protein